jgi:hypothetical protein
MNPNEEQTQYFELTFPDHVAPGDLKIIREANREEPGRLCLLTPRIEAVNSHGFRVYSNNGGAMIGIVCVGRPEPPFDLSYWLEGDND